MPKEDVLLYALTIITLLKITFKTKVLVIPFKLLDNLKDGFFYSAWKYLDEEFRRGISVFAKSSQKIVSSLVKKLAAELKSGAWDRKYGHVRGLHEYDGGYLFFSVKKTTL